MLFSQSTEWGQTKSGFIKSLCSRGTSSLKFRDLWHFDPVALWLYDPSLPLGVSERTNCAHTSFKLTDVKPASGTDLKKTHQSFFKLQCQLSTLIQSHMSGDAHVTAKFLTHCVIWHSPEARKLQRRKTGKNATAIFNLPFSRKKKNAEALLPGTAFGQGSCCACTHIHARTHKYTHTLAASLSASKTAINAQSKIYSSEKQQPKAFQARQLGCRAWKLTKNVCKLQLELTSKRYNNLSTEWLLVYSSFYSACEWHASWHARSRGCSHRHILTC